MAVKVVWRSIKTAALVLLPSVFVSNCIFTKKEAQLTENPKTTIVQSDSMVEVQKTEEKKLVEGSIPKKINDTTKVFDEETEKKIERYVAKLIEEHSLILPEKDVWMAEEIKLRAGCGPGRGWVVNIEDIPPPMGGKHLMIIARIRGIE